MYPSLRSDTNTSQSGNNARAILNVIEALLPALGGKSPNLLCLLKGMSIISLPRCKKLVGYLWSQLEAARMIQKSNSAGIDDILKTMLDHQLVHQSSPRTDSHEPCPCHYFIHPLVRTAAEEHDCKECGDNYAVRIAFWHGIAGTAIRNLLNDPDFDEWWPRPVLAHEAIHHLLAADRPNDACQVLIENWRGLVDSGYHESILQWVPGAVRGNRAGVA